MADPASTGATIALAAGTVVVAGQIAGIPSDALLAGVWGAAISLSYGQRVGSSLQIIGALAATFGISLGLAAFVGPSVAHLFVVLMQKWFSIDVPLVPARMGTCFILALGSQRIAPAIIDRVVGEVKNREAPRDERP